MVGIQPKKKYIFNVKSTYVNKNKKFVFFCVDNFTLLLTQLIKLVLM